MLKFSDYLVRRLRFLQFWGLYALTLCFLGAAGGLAQDRRDRSRPRDGPIFFSCSRTTCGLRLWPAWVIRTCAPRI